MSAERAMILVFAKAPVPGQAKTRLIPRLGPWRAARLQARLTLHALATARAARCGPVELHLTRRHSLFKSAKLQRGRDLGERMRHAFENARKPAILIGSDCPMLTVRDLRRAARLLCAGYDAVLAPAEDGGYALIALRRALPGIFQNIEWGGPRVYADTVSKLAHYRWRRLRQVRDIDRPEDLDTLQMAPLSFSRSAMRSAIRR